MAALAKKSQFPFWETEIFLVMEKYFGFMSLGYEVDERCSLGKTVKRRLWRMKRRSQNICYATIKYNKGLF